MKRRAVLAAGVAGALAGCSGDGSGDDETGDAGDDTEDAEDAEDERDATTNRSDDADEPEELEGLDDGDPEGIDEELAEYALVVLVIDEGGEPIEGATVAVADDGEVIEAFDGADRATTDESGVVEATLPEGEYQAGAIVDDRQTTQEVEVDGDSRTTLRIEPTDHERAAEGIGRAQSALSAAVAEIDDRSGGDLDAADELSRGPVADERASARVAIADAREFETTDEQATTLDALAAVESFLGTLLDGQSWLHGVYRSVGSLVEDLREGEDDRAIYAAADIDRELDDGRGRIEAIEEGADALEGRLEDVEAVDWLWVDDRREALGEDDRAAREFVERVEELLAAEAEFWEGHDAFEDGAYVTARSSFGSARRAFEDVRTAFDPPESSALGEWTGALDCTIAAMATAADGYYWAADAARSGDDEREADHMDRVEEAVAEAEGCGLRPIEP